MVTLEQLTTLGQGGDVWLTTTGAHMKLVGWHAPGGVLASVFIHSPDEPVTRPAEPVHPDYVTITQPPAPIAGATRSSGVVAAAEFPPPPPRTESPERLWEPPSDPPRKPSPGTDAALLARGAVDPERLGRFQEELDTIGSLIVEDLKNPRERPMVSRDEILGAVRGAYMGAEASLRSTRHNPRGPLRDIAKAALAGLVSLDHLEQGD